MANEQEIFAAIAERLNTQGVPEQAEGIEQFLQELGVAAPEGAVAGDSPILAALQSLGGGISGLFGGGEEEVIPEEPEFREAFGEEEIIRQLAEAQGEQALAAEIKKIVALSDKAKGSQERIRAQGITRGSETAALEDIFVSIEKTSKGEDIIGRGRAGGGAERFDPEQTSFTKSLPPISAPQPLAGLSIEELALAEVDENSSDRRRAAAGKLRASKIEVRKLEGEEEQRAAQIESREITNTVNKIALAEKKFQTALQNKDTRGMIKALREIETLTQGPSATTRIPSEKQIKAEKAQVVLPEGILESLSGAGLAARLFAQFPETFEEAIESGALGVQSRRPFLEQLERRIPSGAEARTALSNDELKELFGIKVR